MTNAQDPRQNSGNADWEEVTTEQNNAGMQAIDGERQEERMLSTDPALMTLADGRQFRGSISDMSLGGMLFTAKEVLPVVTEGEKVDVCLDLYGRSAKFSCHMMHQHGNRAGLKLQRT